MTVNTTELAKKMLEWQWAQGRADALAADIEAAVLELGKTQVVGQVRATYRAGTKKYDYLWAWMSYAGPEHTPDGRFAKITYDYRAACIDARITDIPFTQSAPSVSLKIEA